MLAADVICCEAVVQRMMSRTALVGARAWGNSTVISPAIPPYYYIHYYKNA